MTSAFTIQSTHSCPAYPPTSTIPANHRQISNKQITYIMVLCFVGRRCRGDLFLSAHARRYRIQTCHFPSLLFPGKYLLHPDISRHSPLPPARDVLTLKSQQHRQFSSGGFLKLLYFSTNKGRHSAEGSVEICNARFNIVSSQRISSSLLSRVMVLSLPATFSTTEDNHPSIPTQTIYVSASTFADLRGHQR